MTCLLYAKQKLKKKKSLQAVIVSSPKNRKQAHSGIVDANLCKMFAHWLQEWISGRCERNT